MKYRIKLILSGLQCGWFVAAPVWSFTLHPQKATKFTREEVDKMLYNLEERPSWGRLLPEVEECSTKT